MLTNLPPEQKRYLALNGIMLDLAITLIAQLMELEAKEIAQELGEKAKESLQKIPPEAIEKAFAEMDTEEVSNSDARFARITFYAVPEDDSP